MIDSTNPSFSCQSLSEAKWIVTDILTTEKQAPENTNAKSLVMIAEKSIVTTSQEQAQELQQHSPLAPANDERRVCFKAAVRVRIAPYYFDTAEEEQEAGWFSQEDYDRIKQENRKQILSMDDNKINLDEKNHCERGLEHRTAQKARRRLEKIDQVIEAVLEEQWYQGQEGIVDESRIAAVSSRVSHTSKLDAFRVGVEDAIEARSVSRSSSSSSLSRRRKAKSPAMESTKRWLPHRGVDRRPSYTRRS